MSQAPECAAAWICTQCPRCIITWACLMCNLKHQCQQCFVGTLSASGLRFRVSPSCVGHACSCRATDSTNQAKPGLCASKWAYHQTCPDERLVHCSALPPSPCLLHSLGVVLTSPPSVPHRHAWGGPAALSLGRSRAQDAASRLHHLLLHSGDAGSSLPFPHSCGNACGRG